jgi:hypothetical protein
MKQLRMLLAFGFVMSAVPLLAHGQDRGEAKLTLGGKAIVVEYGRPALNKRDVWKDLTAQLPVGNVWRMGANAATTIKTDADLQFGSVTVPKGHYTLGAKRVDEKKWALQFKGGDGAVVAEAPLAQAPVKGEKVEHFTIELRGDKNAGEFEMKWGDTALKAPFTAK